jgi:(1->4)-alpha-D-glucan 1-alpha-D-glucosylmutase
MRLPTATYRLQFRGGMDFDRAATLVPYLDALGVSHLYASPLFTATPGSTHGYDITDPTEIDPTLGGRAGLERLSAALKSRGMGLVLDIVPNHMAFAPQTPWLRDVLRRGEDSRFARHFDLDTESERLRLPWLPDHFEEPSGRDVGGGRRGRAGARRGRPARAAGHHRLARRRAARGVKRRDPAAARRTALAARPLADGTGRADPPALLQRDRARRLRVEDAQVFEDTHALLIDLVERGIVDALRIDHVDGLADPGAYLARSGRGCRRRRSGSRRS